MSELPVSRRSVLLGAAGLAGAVATGGTWWALRAEEGAGDGRVPASSDAVARTERARQGGGTGRTARTALTAEPAEIDLGGRVVRTWAYNGQLPGPVVRCTAGDELTVEVANRLPEPTTVHWHGLRLRNDMDGVPHLTQEPVAPDEHMRYEFVAPDAGTYWLHPHVGVQRERGLYCPLIIDDPREPGDYDVEFVVVLDDWIDGAGATPDDVLDVLRTRGAKGRYTTPVRAGKIADASASWEYHVPAGLANPPKGIEPEPPASRMASSVEFPFYLLGGRLPTAPRAFRAKPGQRARIRVINAGGASVFRLALGGHRLTVTHTDGFPVEPVTVDTLQVASGERYDLLVTLADGVFPLVAVAEGKGAQALGVVRTASGPAPPPTAAPSELAGRLLGLSDLRATPAVHLDESPERTHTLYLTGDMNRFAWRINAETYHHQQPFEGITPMPVREVQRVRLEMINQTPMYHPMHLHGHTFAVRAIGDTARRETTKLPRGTRKDTVMVGPGERVVADLVADNPGQWLVHCHNAYHMASGMATVVSYRADGG
ncbi:multicopper oxidase family protein [Qaidamihabitans albus]|uniref:multicopper oxidase family protein n=1 Tax=Qaidamihabitans albus TaxID=2795733 RepID=UPI0018F14E50|nr:multicopper oxidase family protein [Qaidamihabitans albus]